MKRSNKASQFPKPGLYPFRTSNPSWQTMYKKLTEVSIHQIAGRIVKVRVKLSNILTELLTTKSININLPLQSESVWDTNIIYGTCVVGKLVTSTKWSKTTRQNNIQQNDTSTLAFSLNMWQPEAPCHWKILVVSMNLSWLQFSFVTSEIPTMIKIRALYIFM